MTFLDSIKTKSHYTDKSISSLTSDEIELFYKQKRRTISVQINEDDYQYIQQNKLNMSRIVFFLVNKWIRKKKVEWGENQDGPKEENGR